jgi:subtilisin family serine protease
MRMRRRPNLALPALAAVAAVAWVVCAHTTREIPSYSEATTWRGLVGEAHPQVTIGQRRIVVLRTPSVAQRLSAAKYATEQQERAWTAQAYAAQQQVLVNLAAHGLGVRPDYTYARVIDGFSAQLDPRAEALLEQDPSVAGVFPVRAAFPATVSATKLVPAVAPPPVALPGFDGLGVQIALLDTGVDRAQPYLGGRVEAGIDVIRGTGEASAHPDPQNPDRRERHGTELAGLLVGSGGPQGMHGVAPGATVFPVRVAGWQPDARGHDEVYARSDQLIAGLERAVDPNGDGDAHDAARVALIGVSEPYAAFADSPEAQAVNGAFALDTLVVVPAGNEGSAGPSYGSLDGPAGAAHALTVAAVDPRPSTASVHLSVWRGLDVTFDGRLPLLGAVVPPRPQELEVGVPSGDGEQVSDYFSPRGIALVAGKAALVQAGGDPGAVAVAASQAGAAVLLFYGGNLPAGSLGLSSDVDVPVVAVPETAARAVLAGIHAGRRVGVSVGLAHLEPNELAGRVASFSSRGLAFSGALEPDVAAPGIGLATSDPGGSPDGEPAFATVNGTSAAAAAVAGDAAVLAQARPELTAPELLSLLVGSARPNNAPAAAGGSGIVDVGASAAGELTASLTSLALRPGQHATLTLHNVSSRRLVVTASDPNLRIVPGIVKIGVGRSARLRIRSEAQLGSGGFLELQPAGGQPLRLAWAVPTPPPAGTLLPQAALDDTSFAPSDETPAVLSVQAGRVYTRGGLQVEPVARLDVLLYTGAGAFIGVLGRERDLLPGSYEFGITGRSPTGSTLRPGRYELRLVAWPTGRGAPSRAHVSFSIQSG